MKLTAIGLVAMVTIVVQLSPTMACDVKDLSPCSQASRASDCSVLPNIERSVALSVCFDQ
ncbi:hypothetical protein F2Q70_00032039 [Brassica cretica]|uniref:Uncharacterized protein n=1 Tax=Brassica cretica TaxID=69181 RepID=A0A8S9FIE6_BRACR|nr:hypothetical protein F2Q70_00032039 [Brassica cretica]